MTEHLLVREDYKRPCFAICAICPKHGVIVFADGSYSDPILSIEGGKTLLKTLVASDKISEKNAEQIEDQLNCSGILPTEGCVIELAEFLHFAVEALRVLSPAKKSREEPNDGSQSFSA
ncbi:MAG: hypothetical protein EXS59_02370 [Candidatus Taylorbacteria bacterium]|nr:hypothetical protein [Candidatus Taylorbacteria bacterium]